MKVEQGVANLTIDCLNDAFAAILLHIANIGIKEKPLKGLENSFCYRRISITGGSVRAGFNCSYL